MFDTIAILGAGTMGHGIAQVSAQAGSRVRLFDPVPGAAERGLAAIRKNLDGGVAKGKVTAEAREAALANLDAAADLKSAVSGADMVVEAAPERLELKRALFLEVEPLIPGSCVLATNTSSISIASIGEPLANPGRLIGTHFFNPVHLMALLEIVVSERTRPDTVDDVRAWGARLGKECIVVRDFPGFATSRLGVCLGMEAIRMVEQGVASPEDIDKAMVLGYRHPVGPLRLTDMVGLDVRLAIGEHLARELNNPAFNPPDLMRRMVSEGKLGKKAGQGFYTWEEGK